MQHVFWLRKGRVAGRTGPNKDPWDPQLLREGGIGAVLSVNDGELVHPDELAAADIDYRCVPLSDSAPPLAGDAGVCASALPEAFDFVASSLARNRATLVHCKSGKDRTGMFLCYYLCRAENLSPADAMREVRRVRPIAFSADGWEALTLEVLEQHEQAAASFTTRAADATDAPWLIDLRLDTMGGYLAASGEQLSLADQRARVMHQFEHIRIIEQAGQRIGMVKAVRSPDAFQLVQIQLAPAHQGRGIGARIVSDLLAEASTANVPVTLSVLKVNPARRLYERLGFRVTAEKDRSLQMTAEPRRG